MSARRESLVFAVALAALLAGFFHESLFGGRVLSPGDVVYASASFGDAVEGDYEPANRLLMDPVLQFEPWLEFTRSELRAGRLPLWNSLVGCGAPHLANGQSAVFDPFHLIAYFGTLPGAIAWMAFARLWVAGQGAYRLSRAWGYSAWGRWFCGLAFPFCGFLVVWLLYPVTNVAVWLPWLLLATDRALEGRRFGVAGLAVVSAFAMLGGHVQTSAHVLLACGLYAAWALAVGRASLTVHTNEIGMMGTGRDARPTGTKRRLRGPAARWAAGIALGVALAAIEVVPLAAYLARSPVWSDRQAEKKPILSFDRPRIQDAATTAFPYLYGSQRRGHPHLAKAVGAHNLNETAGGFAGLATLLWLAPAAWMVRKERPRVRFLVTLGTLGALGAFGVPPVSNVLRALPVLDVADNRRLTLWVAFSLVMLGGAGIDSAAEMVHGRLGWGWSRSWFALALLFAIGSAGVIAAGPKIRSKAIAHYEAAARAEPGADPITYRQRAERQARLALGFVPRYGLIVAAHLALLAGLAEYARRRRSRETPLRFALLMLALGDLLAFGYGLNPAIRPSDVRPESELIAYLRREVPPPLRIISVGAELPPNLLMRYGLADARNYDSVELSSAVAWLDPLYEPEPGRPSRTSRRAITWEGVLRARDRLELANVAAVVGASPPPAGQFARVDRVGRVWVARLEPSAPARIRENPGEIRIDLTGLRGEVGWVAETFDPGWTVEVDGLPAETHPFRDTFLGVRPPPGAKVAIFRYRPIEVRVAAGISLSALVASLALMARGDRPQKWRVRLGRPFRARVESESTPQPVSHRTADDRLSLP